MKERLKELGWWLEGKLKDLCGEITPDKRITVILIMLLILVIGNLYLTFSTLYNWGKESEREKRLEIEHIRKPRLERHNKHRNYDFMDSPAGSKRFDPDEQRMKQDSIDTVNNNKKRFREYERTIKNKYGTKAKA